jgi:hypothetical protein
VKPKLRIAAPPVDLRAAVGARLDALLAELRAEADAHPPDALLCLPVEAAADGRSPHEAIRASRAGDPEGLLAGRYALTGSRPVTIGEGLDLVERGRDAVLAEVVAEIERCADALVEPKLRAAVLARGEVVARWPWPEWTLVLDVLTVGYWPGAAAPLDVARWAQKRLNAEAARLGEGDRPGDGLVMDAERGSLPRTWTARAPVLEVLEVERNADGFVTQGRARMAPSPDGPELRYPAAGLALLFLAEREVEAGLRRPAVAIDAGKSHHELLTGWKGIPRDGVRHRAAPGGAAVMDGRVELLLPGTATQLALPLPMEGLSASAVALLRELRGAAGLRHWCALQRLLSVEGGRQGWVRWTLDEHLEAMGYGASTREDPTKRAEAAAEVEVLTKLELVVYDATNTLRYRAPLLMVGGRFERIAGAKWALEGMELKINELLYSGVRTPGGEVGANWMPAPVELAKLDHARHPYAHGLGMLLAIRMRWDIGDGRALRLTGRTLLDLAGIPYAERRAVEAWRKLERELDALEKVELLTYRWAADPWTLAAVCEVAPAGWMMDRVGRGLVPVERPPASIPRTGAELLEWRTARGWSQRAAAGRLGVSQQALSKAEAKPAGELGAGVLDALKRLAVTTKRGGSPPE